MALHLVRKTASEAPRVLKLIFCSGRFNTIHCVSRTRTSISGRRYNAAARRLAPRRGVARQGLRRLSPSRLFEVGVNGVGDDVGYNIHPPFTHDRA
eukprot:364810-Chlamydomonas_euryale.AAC.15